MPSENEPKIGEKEFQPFLSLGKYLSQDFLKTAENLLFLVRECGLSKVAAKPSTKEEFLEFVGHVHEGWKEAQKQIAQMLTDALRSRDKFRAEVKEAHRRRDRQGQQLARKSADRAEIQIVVLRRMLDVILWTILAGQHSTLRRLMVVGGAHNLSIKNIADAMPVADHYNKDPHVIALCTDMLSLVHVGDLMIANRKDGKISFAELKAGEKNLEMMAAASFALESGCEQFESLATAEFDDADVKHYRRTKKQLERNKTIVDTIRNEGGTDPNTGAKVGVYTTDEPPELWCETIMRCYERLSETQTWAIATVDDCVHVGVYSNCEIAFVGFKSWMGEIKCKSPIYNLTDSFRDPSTRPLGATFLSLDLQKKILRGDILVIMCLDIPSMMEKANEMRPGFLDYASKRETADMRVYQYRMLEYEGRLIRARIGKYAVNLGEGFRDRILFDQQRPLQLIRHHIARMLSESESSGD